MDKFSLKDSGRGDSEAGDSDYEPGRESPLDRLLGEGFTEIYAPDGRHRSHAGTTLPQHPPHPILPPLHFSLRHLTLILSHILASLFPLCGRRDNRYNYWEEEIRRGL